MKSPKKIITVLLLFGCLLSGIILAYTPSFIPNKITTKAELDSLIQLTFQEANISQKQIRTSTIQMDSSFSRKIFRVRVPSDFSKTSFHLLVHKRFYSLGFHTPSRVVFPEKDMNIYIENEGTILSTIRLMNDDSLITVEEE